jgi:hypothetical protein
MQLTDKFLESLGKRNNIIGRGHDHAGWAISGYDVFKTEEPNTYRLVRRSTGVERLISTVSEFIQTAYEDGVIEGERNIQNKLDNLLGINSLEHRVAQRVINLLAETIKPK